MIPVRQLCGLSRIPSDPTAAREWMRRHEVELHKQSGPGGVRHVVDPAELPEPARAALAAREAERAGLPGRESAFRADLWEAFDRARQATKDEALRAAAMARMLVEGRRHGLGVKARRQKVREAFGERGTSAEALKRLEATIKGEDPINFPALLLRRRGDGPPPGECDPRAWDMLVADYLRPSRPAFSPCYKRMCEAAAAEGWAPIPAERTLRRRIEAEVPRAARVLARHGRKAAADLHPSQTRDRSHFAPCEAVNADGHTFDVFVTAPWRPKPFRPVLVAVQDLYSGMILGWRLGETECWPLVRLAFLDVLRDHGVPRAAWLDNGRAFASKWITGGQLRRFRFKVKEGEPEGLLTSLGMTVHWTIPERAQSKPIERAFGDLCEEIARHPACEGAYTGNKPHAKPENYGERAIPWDDFKALVAAQIARHNARPGRNTPVCNGRSFDETYRAAVAEAVIPRASPAQLRMLAMVADKVRARAPSGEVHLMGTKYGGAFRYWAEELVEWAGRDVQVRFDPDAPGAPAAVYSLDGRFICDAQHVAATPFFCPESAQTLARSKANHMRRIRDGLREHSKLTPAQVAGLLPEWPQAAPPPEPAAVRLVPTREAAEFIRAGAERQKAEREARARAETAWLERTNRLLEARERQKEAHQDSFDRNLSRAAEVAGRG